MKYELHTPGLSFFKRTLLVALAVFLTIYIVLFILANIFGKSLLTNKLQQALGKKVSIGSFSVNFPSVVVLKQIEIEDVCRIEEVDAAGGLVDLFRGSFSISSLKIIRPMVRLNRGLISSTQEVVAGLPSDKTKTQSATGNSNQAPAPKPKALPRFSIGKLTVVDGSFNFTDNEISKEGLTIRIRHLNVDISNINLGGWRRRPTFFQITGSLPWQRGVSEEGSLNFKGWIDIVKKNMQANLKIDKIDAIYLYPYYSYWVDLEKARIEKATLNFSSNITSINNNVTAQCRLELANIVRKPRTSDEPEQKAERITNAVLDIFKAMDQGKVVLDFTVNTKMDRPEFGFGNIKMAFESKLSHARTGIQAQDMVVLPVKLFEGAVRGGRTMTKSLFDGIAAAGNEMKRAFVETFVKPPKVQEDKVKAAEIKKAQEEKAKTQVTEKTAEEKTKVSQDKK